MRRRLGLRFRRFDIYLILLEGDGSWSGLSHLDYTASSSMNETSDATVDEITNSALAVSLSRLVANS